MREIPFSFYLRLPEGSGGPRADDAIRSSEYFTSREWFRLLAETCLEPGQDAVVHRLESAGASEAAGEAPPLDLPLTRSALRCWGLVGQQLHGLANFYSSYYGPPGLARNGAARAALAAWARAVAAGALPGQRGAPDRLVLRALDEQDGTLELLEEALGAAAFRLERFRDFGNWRLPCAGLDFESYWKARPGSLRSTVRRKGRALAREHAVAFRCLTRAEEAEAAVAAYSAVQARAWQPDEPFPRFIPTLIRRGLAAGSLRLWLLEVDGQPVAAQIWTLAGGEATIFKLAYDSAWKAHSPGTLLTHEAMRRALEEDDFSCIDFGRGDDRYKSHWMSERRQRWGLAAYNRRGLLGNLLALRNLGPRRLRALAARQSAPSALAASSMHSNDGLFVA